MNLGLTCSLTGIYVPECKPLGDLCFYLVSRNVNRSKHNQVHNSITLHRCKRK